MSLETKFETFKTKHELDDSAIAELLSIFNESFVELAHKLLKSTDVSNQNNQNQNNQKQAKTVTVKKWATKIAAEYANENDVTLDDFDKEKITKKDIDEFVKIRTSESHTKLKTEKSKKEPVKKETVKEKCKGITKNGEPCSRSGTEKPSGSSNCFCFRHAMDWKNYEISSDSDLEEEEIFKDPVKKIPNLEIKDDDDDE